jgi:GTP-binding protein
MIDEYIIKRENLKYIFQICDISVITAQDKNVNDYLQQNNKNFFVILNKVDKLSQNQINANINRIVNFFNIDKTKILLVSAKKKIGIKNIIGIIKSKT